MAETKHTRDIARLIEAAKALLPHLHASDDPQVTFVRDIARQTAGDKLREQADAADRKDYAIKKFRVGGAQFEE